MLYVEGGAHCAACIENLMTKNIVTEAHCKFRVFLIRRYRHMKGRDAALDPSPLMRLILFNVSQYFLELTPMVFAHIHGCKAFHEYMKQVGDG